MKLMDLWVELNSKGISKVKSDVDSVKKAAVAVTDGVNTLQNALVSLGLIYGVKKLVQDFIDYSSAISKASQLTGVGVENLQAMKYAADQNSVSFESLNTGYKFLIKNMMLARDQGGPAAEKFQKLGIAFKNMDGSLRPVNDVFLELADRIKNAKSPTEQSALALQFFGKSGMDLVPMLKEGRVGIEDLIQKAEDLGIVLDESMIRKGEDLEKTMKTINVQLKSVGMTLVSDLAPAISAVVKVLSGFLSTWKELFGKQQEIDQKRSAAQMKEYQDQLNKYAQWEKAGLITHKQRIEAIQKLNALDRGYTAVLKTEGDATDNLTDDVEGLTDEEKKLVGQEKILAALGKGNIPIYKHLADANREFWENKRLLNDLTGEIIFKYHGEYDAVWDLTKIYQRLTDIATSGFNQFFNVVADGANVFRAFGNVAISILKNILVELATAITMAGILNVLFPGGLGATKGFGGFLKGMLGFQNPANDMFATREGGDFARLFKRGFMSGIGILGGMAAGMNRQAQSEPLIIYFEPGAVVKRMSDMDQVEKTTFYRNVVRKTQRLEA